MVAAWKADGSERVTEVQILYLPPILGNVQQLNSFRKRPERFDSARTFGYVSVTAAR
jgi:hypothetical protein